MKNLFFVIALVAILSLNASGQAVPSNIESAFSKQFPKASNVKWDKENAIEWEAEFKMNAKEEYYLTENLKLKSTLLSIFKEIKNYKDNFIDSKNFKPDPYKTLSIIEDIILELFDETINKI